MQKRRRRISGRAPGFGNPYWLAIKAGLACMVTLVIDHLTGNPDHVSSTFIATLCVSPTALMGLRRASQQLLGSLLGGLWGTLVALLGLATVVSIPFAVTGALLTSFILRLGLAYPVVAFTALFVLAVPRGDPFNTFLVRIVAVLTGTFAGFLVNVLVSGRAYRQIYQRRLNLARALILEQLPTAVDRGFEGVLGAFNGLAQLEEELELAAEELRWRRNTEQHPQVILIWRQVERLHELLHLMCEMHVEAHRADLLRTEAPRAFATWLRAADGDPPPIAPVFEDTASRLILARYALDR